MFEERKLEWMAPMAGGWGAGGGGGGGGGSSILTPDGLTTPQYAESFDVKAYKASGAGLIYYGKTSTSVGVTTLSTRTSGDAAKDHKFAVGQGVAVLRSGPACTLTAPDAAKMTVTNTGAAITFTVTDDANDIITSSAEMPAITADAVRVSNSGGALPTGLAAATTYYVRKQTVLGTTWTFHPTASDATNNLNKIAITGGSGTNTIVGYTEHNVTVTAHDGRGGYTAPSSAIQSFYWNPPAGWVAHYRRYKLHIPYGAVALSVHGRGTSSRKLLVHLDTVTPWRADAADAWSVDFTGIADSGGGVPQLTGVNSVPGHGIQAGDYVNIRATSSLDTEYNYQSLVASVGGSTITLSGAPAFTDTASGRVRLAHCAFDDMGDNPPLHATKWLPDVQYPTMAWGANRAYWEGQRCYDSSDRLWIVERAVGGRMSGSSAPSFTASETAKIVDNELVWVRDWTDVPVAEPAAAGNQVLLTTIATVPTTSTATLTDAATVDIGTNALIVSHNDALAMRNCVAAAKALGRPAQISIPAGKYKCILPKPLDTTYWSLTNPAFTVDSHFLLLSSGQTSVASPEISIVASKAAVVDVRMMQSGWIVEDFDSTFFKHPGNVNLIGVGLDNTLVQGGVWKWIPSFGGLTEFDNTSTSYGQSSNWIGYAPRIAGDYNASTTPTNVTIRDAVVHFPTIGSGLQGIISGIDGFRRGKMQWENCYLYYGGGDGDQTFLPWGDFSFVGGEIRNVRRLGSHGFYLGINNTGYRIANCRIIDVTKNAIQIRGQGSDTWAREIQIDGVTFINSGAVLVGDLTSSNRVHKVLISNCLGNSDLTIAETRNVSVSNSFFRNILVREDCKDVKIHGTHAEGWDFTSTTNEPYNYDIDVVDATALSYVKVANCDRISISKLRMLNPYVKSTNLNSGVYQWDAVSGVSNTYFCKNRATGFNPSISSPTGMLVRDVASVVATDLLSLNNSDGWYYGNTEIQTIAISGSPTTGSWTASFNGAGPSATIALAATAATVQATLRTLTGLSSCTVTQSGTGNNLTYTIAMTGFSGDPPQITSANTFDAGTITHATPNAYPGYDTVAVGINDSQHYDPDVNMAGTIWTITTGSTAGIILGAVVNNARFDNWDIKSTWTDQSALLLTSNPAALAINSMHFTKCDFIKTGLAASGTIYMVDFGGSAAQRFEDVRFNLCKFDLRNYSDVLRVPVRWTATNGGDLTFFRCDLKMFGHSCIFTNGVGNVNIIGCDVQDNVYSVTPATADTWTHVEANLTGDGTYHPVVLMLGAATTLPTTTPQVVANTQYWKKTSNLKLYATETNAINDASAIDVTAVSATQTPVLFRVLDAARLALASNFEFTGDLTYFNAYGDCRDNTWRGSKYATYAQIVANANNYQLIPLVSEHRLSTDASRTITGLDAPASGTFNRNVRTINVGTTDIVWAHEEVEEQTIAISGTPTGGSFTITHTGGTTASISHTTGTPASAAVVQAALRLVPGLGLVTVTQAGSGTDLTYTVKMKGFNSDPAQMTSTSSLTGGAPVITHATTVAYTSEWINRIISHTGADLTQAGGRTLDFEYDTIDQCWRTIGS